MKRKAVLLLCIVLVISVLGSLPAFAIKTTTTIDPYFGKYEKPVTITFAGSINATTEYPKGDSISNNVWTRAYKEDLNIVTKYKWSAVDATGSYRTKMNLAIASNDLPDIMYLSDYSQFDKLVNAGKIVDLKTYYDKYAYPMLKKNIMEDGGLALQWGTTKGKLMGLSTESVNYMAARMVYIRHDWFVKSGLPKPETLEDVLKIAAAFKAEDPDNRFGIPLLKELMNDSFCDIVGIANSVGAYPRQWLDDGKGKLVYGTLQPQMRKTLQIYADLYKKGLIDPAFASLDGTKVGEQLTSGKIGVVLGGFWLPTWPLNSLWDNEGVEWDQYPLLKSSTLKGTAKVQLNAPEGRMLVVRKGFSNPEALFKMLNYTTAKVYDPQRADTKKFHSDPDKPQYGYFSYNPVPTIYAPRMTNYNTNPNVTNAIDKKNKSYLKTPHDLTQYASITKYFDGVKAGKRPEGNLWGTYKLFYGPDSTFGILNKYIADKSYLVTKLTGYQSPEMIRSWGSLTKLEEQYVTEIISGKRPVSDFSKFVQAWRDAGGEVVEYEVNQWYKNQK